MSSSNAALRVPPSRLRNMLLGSLLLHGALAVFILLVVRLRPPPEPQSPPGIAMLFESGSPKAPAVPAHNQWHDLSTSTVPPTAAAPAPPTASSPSPLALAMPPAPPTRNVPPEIAEPPAPAPAEPPSPTPPQSAGLLPLPIPPTPPPIEQPTPPRAVTPPPRPAPQVAARPVPKPLPRTEPRREPRPASPFSAPMNFSFGNTARGRFADSQPNAGFLGPTAAEGQTRATSQFGDIQTIGPGRPGSDWFGELRAWLEAHKYYPHEAAMNGEDGIVVVHVVVDHTGHVDTVELRSRSGSQWLDLGAQAMFRGAHLPPFPPETPFPDVDLQVTIHYIIIRH